MGFNLAFKGLSYKLLINIKPTTMKELGDDDAETGTAWFNCSSVNLWTQSMDLSHKSNKLHLELNYNFCHS